MESPLLQLVVRAKSAIGNTSSSDEESVLTDSIVLEVGDFGSSSNWSHYSEPDVADNSGKRNTV